MNFEAPLTSLVWLTSIVSVGVTYVVSYLLIPDLGGDGTLWWKLSTIITCGTLAGAIIPELVKVFTSTESRARQGGRDRVARGRRVAQHPVRPHRRQLQRLLDGPRHRRPDGHRLRRQHARASATLMMAPAVFAFGLVAFGFLGMGPVTIAVDSYGPVTDNAQSVYELSVIETIPGIKEEIKKDFGFDVNFESAKHLLEENDGAGNTFKATAKPVLIGTAVVGATTMIFSIIVVLTSGLTHGHRQAVASSTRRSCSA